MARLQETMRLMEEQRQHVIDRRRRRLIIIGGSLSMICHLLLMTYLALLQRGGGGGGGGSPVAYQLAILNEEELTELEQTSFDELAAGPDVDNQPQAELPELDAIAPEAGVGSAAANSVPSLGASGDGSGGIPGTGDGSGGGGGLGLGGGGGGTSFFGIGSKGTRFAYIVDVSGSMGQDGKLELAMRELAKSVDALPDFTHFYVLLFSSNFMQPPMQKGWMRARKPLVRQFITWLSEVDPGGGTEPRSSFLQIFALDVRPDVIYFLTDGQFNDITAEEIASLNASGKKAIINTIQFGDPSGEELLTQIAKQSCGV
jgi:hypothetical protein